VLLRGEFNDALKNGKEEVKLEIPHGEGRQLAVVTDK
jgi:hypothetical protein